MSCLQALSVVAAYKVKAEYIWADGQEGAPQKVRLHGHSSGSMGQARLVPHAYAELAERCSWNAWWTSQPGVSRLKDSAGGQSA